MKSRLDLMEEISLIRIKKGEAYKRGERIDHFDELIRELEREKSLLYSKQPSTEVIGK